MKQDDRQRFDQWLEWLAKLYSQRSTIDRGAYFEYLKQYPTWAVGAAIKIAPEAIGGPFFPAAGQLGALARRKVAERARVEEDKAQKVGAFSFPPAAQALVSQTIAKMEMLPDEE